MQTKLEMYIDTNVLYKLENVAKETNKTVSDYVIELINKKVKQNEYQKWFNSLEPEIREMIGVVSVEDKYRNMDTKELISLLRNEANLEKNFH